MLYHSGSDNDHGCDKDDDNAATDDNDTTTQVNRQVKSV